jgi:6-pyruvoyltetrahydropterin/6-carboxytetrahydropterin synthase
MADFKIVVEKDYLVFASGHFLTYHDTCETLHGHNYRAKVEMEGQVEPSGYLWDFVALKRIMRRLVDEWDHKMLLPLHNEHLRLTDRDGSVEVGYKDRRYVFPRSDVVLLPIPNTSVEMLARHLHGLLKEELKRAGGGGTIELLAVEVEESFGQSGAYRERLGGRGR